VQERLHKPLAKLSRHKDGDRALVGADVPTGDAMTERHQVAITEARKRHVGVLLQETNELPRDHDADRL